MRTFVPRRVLDDLNYVQWDRMVLHPNNTTIYGWILRKDGKMDFVVLDYLRRGKPFYMTSSKEFSKDIGLKVEGIDGTHEDCIPVEDLYFGINRVGWRNKAGEKTK